jgi:hypothetical protein
VQTVSPSSGVVTIDQSRDNVFLIDMSASVTSVVFTNNTGKAGQKVELHFVQDATGSRTLAGLPASVKLSGAAITLTTAATKCDVLTLRQMTNPVDAGGVKYREIARDMNVAA